MEDEIFEFDCLGFPCRDACCSFGVDVQPEERDRLINLGYATAEDFTGPTLEDGDLYYRTRVGSRGCVFLKGKDRGCRLHQYNIKPAVCNVFPRDEEEAKEMYDEGALPCFPQIFFAENNKESE